MAHDPRAGLGRGGAMERRDPVRPRLDHLAGPQPEAAEIRVGDRLDGDLPLSEELPVTGDPDLDPLTGDERADPALRLDPGADRDLVPVAGDLDEDLRPRRLLRRRRRCIARPW